MPKNAYDSWAWIEESRQRDEQYPGTRSCGDNLGKRTDTNCDRNRAEQLEIPKRLVTLGQC
nr:hypothetical protein [Nostoc sp. 'Peltigera membranacea cyanobiont' 213]